jgi:hypothetical protein
MDFTQLPQMLQQHQQQQQQMQSPDDPTQQQQQHRQQGLQTSQHTPNVNQQADPYLVDFDPFSATGWATLEQDPFQQPTFYMNA